jgi:hypothetical protein
VTRSDGVVIPTLDIGAGVLAERSSPHRPSSRRRPERRHPGAREVDRPRGPLGDEHVVSRWW